MPPDRAGAWRAVQKLVDLDVAVAGPVGAGLRVELVDRRVWTELVSLAPDEAVQLADRLRDAAMAAAERGPSTAAGRTIRVTGQGVQDRPFGP